MKNQRRNTRRKRQPPWLDKLTSAWERVPEKKKPASVLAKTKKKIFTLKKNIQTVTEERQSFPPQQEETGRSPPADVIGIG